MDVLEKRVFFIVLTIVILAISTLACDLSLTTDGGEEGVHIESSNDCSNCVYEVQGSNEDGK